MARRYSHHGSSSEGAAPRVGVREHISEAPPSHPDSPMPDRADGSEDDEGGDPNGGDPIEHCLASFQSWKETKDAAASARWRGAAAAHDGLDEKLHALTKARAALADTDRTIASIEASVYPPSRIPLKRSEHPQPAAITAIHGEAQRLVNERADLAREGE